MILSSIKTPEKTVLIIQRGYSLSHDFTWIYFPDPESISAFSGRAVSCRVANGKPHRSILRGSKSPRCCRRIRRCRLFASDRACFEGITSVLPYGIRWNAMPRCYPSSTTCNNRFHLGTELGL